MGCVLGKEGPFPRHAITNVLVLNVEVKGLLLLVRTTAQCLLQFPGMHNSKRFVPILPLVFAPGDIVTYIPLQTFCLLYIRPSDFYTEVGNLTTVQSDDFIFQKP